MERETTKHPQMEASGKQEGSSRRSFLTGTGGAALAVAATGLFGGSALSETKGAAPAKQTAGEPSIPVKMSHPKAAKPHKYPHLLSPIKIGNFVLKNRMIGTASSPHFLPGPETFPNEAITYYYANKARQGAALVVLSQPIDIYPVNDEDTLKIREREQNQVNPDHGTMGGHFPTWDLSNSGNINMFSQLTEAVHAYGSLCLWKPKINAPAGYDVSPGNDVGFVPGGGPQTESKEISEEMLEKILEEVSLKAALGKECGFDGIFLHCAYRAPLPARMLSPLTNRRTDKYGGSLENRARFAIQLADAIKKRCGQDHFIFTSISGCEPKGGYTVDDAAEFAKMFTGHMDLLDVKGDPVDPSHPSNFILEKTPYLYETERMKKLGVTMPLVSDGGFTNLNWAEEAIFSGKADAVGMSRIFITTPELETLALEGRNEDVVPCLRCNACHGGNYFKPWNSTCQVNPTWGLEHKIDKMFAPPREKKNVAVIGGGPAGMEAALTAARRGHTVTLYEKTGKLGGNFGKIENVSFKWTHKDFKDYLVRQVTKAGVKVRLNTEADPATMQKEGYDAVIAAVGGEPIVPDIPGARNKNVVFAPDIYGTEGTLEKDVVIVGGKEVGTVTGMHLAEKGHNVTVIEDAKLLGGDAWGVHFYSVFQEAWEKLPNFKSVLNARCNGITADGVTYLDAEGKQQSIKAGSVVIALGLKPKVDEAYSFRDAGDRFYLVGDCQTAGDLQMAMRSAFSKASML